MPWYLIVTATSTPECMLVWTKLPISSTEYSYLGTVPNEEYREFVVKYPKVQVAKYLKKYINTEVTMVAMYKYVNEELQKVNIPANEVTLYSSLGWYTSEELARDNA